MNQVGIRPLVSGFETLGSEGMCGNLFKKKSAAELCQTLRAWSTLKTRRSKPSLCA
jgi:hypothetical protein